MSDVRIGLDLGTSGLKGIALDESGSVVARASMAYPTSTREPGAREQDPADWIAAVETVVGSLSSQVDPARWRGIGLSAMLPTLVTVDADGRPTGPAITWEDGRAEPQGVRMREAVGADLLYARTGQWVDGRYLLPMWQRIVDTDPDRASRTAGVWGAKDLLVHHLTGRAVTDPSIASGFGCFDLTNGAWDDALAGGIDVPGLPEVAPSSTLLPLAAPAARALGLPEGLPVCVGAADSVLGALGMGARGAGEVAYVAGTSTVVLGLSPERLPDDQHRFLVTPTAEPDLWGLEMDLLATGSAVRWLAGLLGLRDERAVLELAASADPERAPVVLPYVAPGEQGALWDPDLVGSVLGLTLATGPADLALGLLAGIVVESRRCLTTLESLGFGRGPLRVAGGSASDAWFRRQLADATGREVLTPADGDTDASAAGAARLTALAQGADLPAPRPGGAVEPDPRRAAWWAERAEAADEARARVGHGVRAS